MSRILVTMLVAAAGLVASVSLPAQIKLEQKYPDERKSKATVKISTQQSLTLNNKPIETSSEQEMVVSSENSKREEDGKLRQTQKIESLKAKLSMPGGVVLEFDSTKPNQPAPGTQFDMFLDLIKANSTATWTVVRGQDNRVLAVEGRDKILDTLDAAKREMLKKQTDPNYLREQANREMDKIPAKPVSKGDSWQLTDTMRLDAGQSLTFKTKYTYQGEVDRNGKKVHQIDVETTDVTYSIDADSPSPLKLASSNLKPKMLEGVILFDNEQGQVVEIRQKVQITGDLKFNWGGNELAGQLDLTMANSTTVE